MGDVVECEIIDGPKLSARVRVGNVDGSTEDEEVVLQASYLAAALIHQCAQHKIPLPRSAKKNLERAGDGLALSFSINANAQAVSAPDD